jgi:tetratricopeptide (TPR) repeat protein
LNRTLLNGLVIGALVGFGIGFFVGHGNFFGDPNEQVSPAAAQPRPAMPAGMPPPGQAAPIPGGAEQLQAQQHLDGLLAATQAEPKNPKNWVDLGNVYFDLHQAQKSVDAYGKALALNLPAPLIPDILTDQGVMFRELKEFDKAISNFKQAAKLNPSHVQSLYNLGIVYSQDKHDAAAAKQAWSKLIEVAPSSPQAQEAKGFLTQDPHSHP